MKGDNWKPGVKVFYMLFSLASNLTLTLDEDILPTMIGILEGGIEMAHQGSSRYVLLF